MYWANYHSHCTFCDGRSSMEDFVKSAIEMGVKKYGFSSHAPLPFRTKWNMDIENFPAYQLEFLRLKEKYKTHIDLYFGLEVDYIHHFSDSKDAFFNDKTFDYLIGSIHYIEQLPNGEYWCIDGEFSDFDKGLQLLYGGDIKLAVKRFYEVTTFMIEKGAFDVIGHFDKISLHATHYESFDMNDEWYQQLVNDVLQLVKQKGLILEINTKSLSTKGITYPHQLLYPKIKELEIPIVVNSDCHHIENVITGFDTTYKTLLSHNFKHLHQINDGEWTATQFNEYGLIE